MPRTHKYTWEKRQIDIPDGHSRVYNKIPVVNLKGHQSSGARAPELWCPFKSGVNVNVGNGYLSEMLNSLLLFAKHTIVFLIFPGLIET